MVIALLFEFEAQCYFAKKSSGCRGQAAARSVVLGSQLTIASAKDLYRFEIPRDIRNDKK